MPKQLSHGHDHVGVLGRPLAVAGQEHVLGVGCVGERTGLVPNAFSRRHRRGHSRPVKAPPKPLAQRPRADEALIRQRRQHTVVQPAGRGFGKACAPQRRQRRAGERRIARDVDGAAMVFLPGGWKLSSNLGSARRGLAQLARPWRGRAPAPQASTPAGRYRDNSRLQLTGQQDRPGKWSSGLAQFDAAFGCRYAQRDNGSYSHLRANHGA